MSIKVWDYKKEFEIEKEEIFKAVEKVFESGRLIFGKSLESFEENFSTYCQTAMGIGASRHRPCDIPLPRAHLRKSSECQRS